MKLCVHAYVIGAVTAASLAGGAYAALRLYRRAQANRLPQKWRLVGTLDNIYVYPVKSCGPVKLDKAECSVLGVRYGWLRDRILMITDTKNNFITARAYPKLFTVATNVTNSVLTLSHEDMEPLKVNLAEIVESGQPTKTAHVWSVPVEVYDCGWEASEWLAKCLNKTAGDFRLVYYASHRSRQLRSNGTLYDEAPYHLINDVSVKDLNDKLVDTQVTHKYFRPNFTFKPLDDVRPFEEDNYKLVKIGENIFKVIKACGRCVLTTIDAETGIRNIDAEPLKTLRIYRQFEKPAERRIEGTSPRMGSLLTLRSAPGGLLSLGDPVYVA